MNSSVEYYLSQIRKFGKKHWRSRQFVSKIETLISEYRLTALRMHGTFTAGFCHHEANQLEGALRRAVGE